jgi:hypothetical protein
VVLRSGFLVEFQTTLALVQFDLEFLILPLKWESREEGKDISQGRVFCNKRGKIFQVSSSTQTEVAGPSVSSLEGDGMSIHGQGLWPSLQTQMSTGSMSVSFWRDWKVRIFTENPLALIHFVFILCDLGPGFGRGYQCANYGLRFTFSAFKIYVRAGGVAKQ